MAWIEKRKAPKAPQGATWRVCDRGADAHPFVVQSGFPRWADADEFLKKFEGGKVQGKTFDPARRRMTLADLYKEFIVKPGLRPSTRALYAQQWEKHLKPALGSALVTKITKAHVNRLISQLTAKECGDATIESVHRLLRAMLSLAVDEDIASVNPAAGVKVRHADEREGRILTTDEIETLVGAMDERYRALVLLMAYRGLRIGEAIYLRVKHLEPMRRRLTIEGAASEVRGARTEGPTKTGKKRTVVLPSFVSEALVRHLAAFGAPLDPESLIFTTELGGPVRQANFRNREWTPALEQLGWGEYVRENGRRHFAPRYRIHDLRHTATSLAILAGAQPKVIQEMGGWSSIDIVMNRYGHLFDTLQDDLAARQEEAYRAGSGVG